MRLIHCHRHRLIALGCLFLISCSTWNPMPNNYKSPLASWQASENFEPRKPQLIIIHHTNMRTLAEALHTLQTGNPQGRVSALWADGLLIERPRSVSAEVRATRPPRINIPSACCWPRYAGAHAALHGLGVGRGCRAAQRLWRSHTQV